MSTRAPAGYVPDHGRRRPPPADRRAPRAHRGHLEPELAFRLAERNRVRLRYAGLDELRRAYSFRDLQSFLDLYYELTAVLLHPQDFTDLADEYLARAAAQGV